MTSTAPSPTTDRTAALRALLVDLDRDGLELARSLRAEREALVGDGALARDLRQAELRFLEDRRNADPDAPDLDRRVGEARHEALDAELRDLRASDPASVGALFDLASLRARYVLEGRHADADSSSELLAERVETVAVGDELLQEAAERFAALTTEEEAFGLREKIVRLEETSALLRRLAKRAEGKQARTLRRFARRMTTQAGDRRLAQRLEGLLGRRGATLLENFSLIGLLIVFVLLFVDLTMTIDPEVHHVMQLVDASICLFFIAEFLLKFSLAPHRGGWFARNVLIDLIPAIPAALYLVPHGPALDAAGGAVYARFLRFLRITAFARYVNALRPILRIVRLVLFLVKGMDSLVQRFSPLLNRNFVFFERATLTAAGDGAVSGTVHGADGGSSLLIGARDERALVFQALRREHVLLSEQPSAVVRDELEDRAGSLVRQYADSPAIPQTRTFGGAADPTALAGGRDIPVEDAIAFLNRLRPEEVGLWLPRADIQALDRIVRVVNAPVVRFLPLVNLVSVHPSPKTAEDRLVALGQRFAFLLERWRDRMLFFADLHGIVTGPQILDRVASAIVKFAKRPATRLLIFGSAVWLLQALLGDVLAWLGGLFGKPDLIANIVKKVFATPLLILGSVCVVFLLLGRWLKSIAGEAADTFKMTSEANFLNLLELVKRRDQDTDLEFLARRVFRNEMAGYEAGAQMARFVRTIRTGNAPDGLDGLSPALYDELRRTSFLYMDFLDGAPLHHSDCKVSEQLLANLSLENVRFGHLGLKPSERKRLRRLRLDDGSLLSGPYLWFKCITESVAVETAKRVIDYNRHALSKEQTAVATREQRAAYLSWLRRRRAQDGGRLQNVEKPDSTRPYQSTEFHALDFLTPDPERERYLEGEFGPRLVRLLRRDRARMIREIFGTRPLHKMPRSQRMVNFYTLYRDKLSGGRVLLLPLFALGALFQSIKLLVQRTVEIVREILAPERAAAVQDRGRAPFGVAIRKIQRMKEPGLLEAMSLRVQFDPEYSGVPVQWSDRTAVPEEESELERDMEFLGLRVRERERFREMARTVRRRVERLHQIIRRMPNLASAAGVAEPEAVRRGERAVTIAFLTNRDDLRTLAQAEGVVAEVINRARVREKLPGAFSRRSLAKVLRRFKAHPVTEWLRRHGDGLQLRRSVRGRMKRAWHAEGCEEYRKAITAWNGLEAGVRPSEKAFEIAVRAFRTRREVSRELAALRAVQSLSVLEVRQYRKLVFELGEYAADGESVEAVTALP